MNQKSQTTQPDRVRCAAYTRKSTAEGLDQEFNTLDAQREAAENYIASQQQEGWRCLPGRYDGLCRLRFPVHVCCFPLLKPKKW